MPNTRSSDGSAPGTAADLRLLRTPGAGNRAADPLFLTMTSEPLNAEIRWVLNQAAQLPLDAAELDDHADLYLTGLSSQASVEVMLELEDRFEIEFPAHMFKRSVFASIAAIAAAVVELKKQPA